MSLTSQPRAAPRWLITVLSVATSGRGFRRDPRAMAANDLSDGALCDIGLPRCLLLAGIADGRIIGPAD